jgi:hypothetical protein
MKIGFYCAMLLLWLAHCAAEVVDRMVAVVNKQVILQSELEEATRVEFLLQGKPLDKLTGADTHSVLQRLIDQALLQQQIVQTAMWDPSLEAPAARLQEVRSQIPGAETDEKWKAMLANYGVTEQDLEREVNSQTRVLRFVDLRFRALVNVDQTEIAAYYQEKLLPELRGQAVPEPPLSDVSEKIQRILVEQGMNKLLVDWLQTLRAQAHIQIMDPETGLAAGAQAAGAPQ